ncbi:MAG: GNAT family N-acetyltransferase [Candidatus Bathyarchaeia archaeon]
MGKNDLEIINAKLNLLSDEDIRAIVEIERHPSVRRWLTDYGDETFEEELKGYMEFFRNIEKNDKVEVLVAKMGGRVVGFLALWRMKDYDEYTRSIGISVHPDYWGKGIATALVREAVEMAKMMGVKKIVIETLEENGAMRRVAEKTGFKMERIKRNKSFKDGKYYNEIVYSLEL